MGGVIREVEIGDVIRLGGVVGHVVRVVHTPGGQFNARIALRDEHGQIVWAGANYSDALKPPLMRPARRKPKPATNALPTPR